MGGYIGIGNKAKRIAKLYVGVNGKAKRVKKAYVGVDGVADFKNIHQRYSQ